MKTLLKFTTLIVFLSCTIPSFGQNSLPMMPPNVFEMVECWLSDTEKPVATEINLDAVLKNHNQFNNQIIQEESWISINPNDGGFMRYKILQQSGNRYTILFQNNGGGTLTTCTKISFILTHRSIDVEDQPKNVRVIQIESIARCMENHAGTLD